MNNRKIQHVNKLDDDTRRIFSLFNHTRDALIFAIDLELQQYNTNFTQIRILYLLSLKNELTTAAIAKWTFRRLNSVSNLVSKMEKKGFVKRIKKKGDSKLYIQITKKGLDLWQKVSEDAAIMTFSILSEDEKKQFIATLEKLRLQLRSILGIDFKPPFLRSSMKSP